MVSVMKNKNFLSAVFITGIVFLMVWFTVKDETFFLLLFVITQLFAGLSAVILILLRFTRIMKTKSSCIYAWTGAIQLTLTGTDLLLLFDHSLVTLTILVFTGLNAFFGIGILADEHKQHKKIFMS
jgi:hypothetical protein